jgi:3-deoxy-D-manno-octulosonic-acid transferase
VGEGLQAKPIIELLRDRRPDLQIAYTHYSPSAATFARSLSADVCDYLPFDTTGDSRLVLDALRPAALIFSKLDVWPILTALASAQGVPVGLISATLPERSSRLGALGRALLGDAYRSLRAVGTIDAETAERLTRLGVRREVIEVTGDTRYDQVWDRAGRADRSSPLLGRLVTGRPTIVAGSTWPSDEAVLLPAYAASRSFVDSRLIIAPHEPTRDHTEPLAARAASLGLVVARLDEDAASRADVVIVDRLGVLGDLYALADIAFVGGGFHGAGLHSVLEPAAYGAPTLFGPRSESSRDAMLLWAAGGGVRAPSTEALRHQLVEWLTGPSLRMAAGRAAQQVVRAGLGAAERTVALVERLLPD